MTLKEQVRVYMLEHPDAKPREIRQALSLTIKQLENARRVIKHGNQPWKPRKKKGKQGVSQQPSCFPLASVWQ